MYQILTYFHQKKQKNPDFEFRFEIIEFRFEIHNRIARPSQSTIFLLRFKQNSS